MFLSSVKCRSRAAVCLSVIQLIHRTFRVQPYVCFCVKTTRLQFTTVCMIVASPLLPFAVVPLILINITRLDHRDNCIIVSLLLVNKIFEPHTQHDLSFSSALRKCDTSVSVHIVFHSVIQCQCWLSIKMLIFLSPKILSEKLQD